MTATPAASKPKKAAKKKQAQTKKATKSGTADAAAKKKKKPPTQKKSQKQQPASTAAALSAVQQQQLDATPPTRTLILDNGGDTVKFGWSHNHDDQGSRQSSSSNGCHRMANLTARLPQQWTVLVGDQVTEQLQNPNSVIQPTRSTERGIITNLGNQVQVWKRILDVLGVRLTPHGSGAATAAAFGWKAPTTTHKNSHKQQPQIPAHTCAVLIALAPHCPHAVLDQIAAVWLEDFGVARVGFCVSAAVAAVVDRPIAVRAHASKTEDAATATDTPVGAAAVVPIACVVDLGWSAIHIVPVYRGKVIASRSIRRIPLGGRHLINLWKYYCSYRQWNMMDQEWVMRQVLEATAFVSLQVNADLRLARRLPAGRRPYDREFVLPDYDTTRTGTVQIPVAVQRQLEKQEKEDEEGEEEDDDEDYDEEKDEDFTEKDVREEDEEDENLDDPNAPLPDVVMDEDESEDDDDEESPEEIRKRLLKQREEEERRRRELEAEQQVLNVTVERFTIPETLFRPSDAGLPSEWANLPTAIVQAIEACPLIYRAGLYQSIQLTGGLAKLPNLKERLEQELRALTPSEYPLDISLSEAPLEQAWKGARKLATDRPYTEWSIGRDEWEKASKRGAWKRLLVSEGGCLI